jgi:hypothetical protein
MRRIANILIEKMKQGPLLLSIPGHRMGKPYTASALLVNEVLEDGILGQLVQKNPSGLWNKESSKSSVFVPFSSPLNILLVPEDFKLIDS